MVGHIGLPRSARDDGSIPPTQGTTVGRARFASPDCGRMQRWRDVTFPSAASRASACPRSAGSRRRPPPELVAAWIEAHSKPRRRGPRPPRPGRLDRPGRGRPPAPGGQPGDEPAHPAPRRGRPPPARRPPSRRGLPGDRRGAPRAVGAQGLARREVRQPLRDLRADGGPGRGRLGDASRTASRGRSTSTTGAPPAGTRSAVATSATARSTRPTWPRSPRPTRGATAWRAIHERFPTLDGDDSLVEQLLDLHTPRQLAGLQAILERIETRSPLGAGRGGDAPRPPPRPGPGLPPERLPGPDRQPQDQRRADPPAGRRPVARAEPVARLRGRLPGGPRLHPAARGGPARADDRPLRRGPPEPGRGDGQRRRPARDAVRRSTRWPPRPMPWPGCPTGRGSGSSWASRRCARTSSVSRPRTSRPAGSSAARPPRSCRSTPSSAAPAGRRGAGSRRRSGGPSMPPRRSSPATDGRSCCSSRAARRGSSRRPSAGSGAGYRLIGARLDEPGEETGGVVEFVPPGAPVPVRPRTRANVTPAVGARWGGRPRDGRRAAGCSRRRSASTGSRFSEADVARTVTETDRRDPPGARRAGPLRADPRRDPRRARPGRPAPSARRPARRPDRRGRRPRRRAGRGLAG